MKTQAHGEVEGSRGTIHLRRVLKASQTSLHLVAYETREQNGSFLPFWLEPDLGLILSSTIESPCGLGQRPFNSVSFCLFAHQLRTR